MSSKFDKKDLNYELLYEYLSEKCREDFQILELKKEILDRQDYYTQKTRLTEIEHQLLLIRNKNG